MKAKNVLKMLDITRPTLCKYVKLGIIKVKKLKNGLYDYEDESVYEFIGLKKERHNTQIVSYARVSTQKQKEQLKEQSHRIYESCISRGIKLDKQYEDIKSGISFKRQGFQKLCEEIIRGNVELLVIENQDRLLRFGYEIFEGFFKYFGCKILVLNDTISNKSYEQELTEDLISIIRYFSIKSYSHRKKFNKIRKELEQEK